jgi:hypothetical protein
MPRLTTVHDEVLGLLNWDEDHHMWTFDAGPVDGRPVRGAILPDNFRDSLAGVRLDLVRACVRWVRENEPAVREHLTAQAFDWWQDACSNQDAVAARTPEDFRARLALRCVYFYHDGAKAKVGYDLAGQELIVSVGPGGTFDLGVDVFDRGFLPKSRLFHEPDEAAPERRLKTSQIQQCQGCGRPPRQGEQFCTSLPENAGRTCEQDAMGEILLCPGCAAKRQSSSQFELAYRICAQCAGPIEPGQIELRSKSSTSMAGSHSITMVLCRRCAEQYDGTSRWLLVFIGLFVVGIVLLGLASWLFG